MLVEVGIKVGAGSQAVRQALASHGVVIRPGGRSWFSHHGIGCRGRFSLGTKDRHTSICFGERFAALMTTNRRLTQARTA